MTLSEIHLLARLEGFEPPAHGLEIRSSIHLSYRRLANNNTTSLSFRQDENHRLKRSAAILSSSNPAL